MQYIVPLDLLLTMNIITNSWLTSFSLLSLCVSFGSGSPFHQVIEKSSKISSNHKKYDTNKIPLNPKLFHDLPMKSHEIAILTGIPLKKSHLPTPHLPLTVAPGPSAASGSRGSAAPRGVASRAAPPPGAVGDPRRPGASGRRSKGSRNLRIAGDGSKGVPQ